MLTIAPPRPGMARPGKASVGALQARATIQAATIGDTASSSPGRIPAVNRSAMESRPPAEIAWEIMVCDGGISSAMIEDTSVMFTP